MPPPIYPFPNKREDPTLDHIKPKSKGGRYFSMKNLQLAHKKCNLERGNDDIEGD